MLRHPTLQELTRALQKWKPNMLYLSAGIAVTGHGSAVNDITLKPLEFKSDAGTLACPNLAWFPASPARCATF